MCQSLREIIAILGPIRVDSVEGGNGLKVGQLKPVGGAGHHQVLHPCGGAGHHQVLNLGETGAGHHQIFNHLFLLVGRKGDKPFIIQCLVKKDAVFV